MSTTIPLTLIEGTMAVPRLRPLDCLPAPFGRDWALLPPHTSVRAELKALYAAILRTFCLNAAAIRSMCRWEPRRTPAATASAGTLQAEAAPTGVQGSAAADPNLAPQGSAHRWTGLAGGACALGGAAVLAWATINHLSQQRATIHATQRASVSRQSAPATSAQAPAPRPVVSNRNGTARLAQPGVGPIASIGSTQTPAARRLPTVDAGNTDRESPQKRTQSRHKARHAVPASAKARQLRLGVTVSHNAAAGHEAAAIRARRWAKPSAAGEFSPAAPAALGIGEYASITMSARTHLRDIASTHSAFHRAVTGADSSGWMKHLAQRRVTEVPEQFVK
jgi:hypothetical protein